MIYIAYAQRHSLCAQTDLPACYFTLQFAVSRPDNQQFEDKIIERVRNYTLMNTRLNF